jgi:hypothetical protein
MTLWVDSFWFNNTTLLPFLERAGVVHCEVSTEETTSVVLEEGTFAITQPFIGGAVSVRGTI